MADDRQHHRTRPSARSGCAQGKRGADAQGLGRSRGGLSTKIHAATEALGLPIRLIGSPGQRNDIALAHDLIDGFEAQAILADKGYDADHLCHRIEKAGTVLLPTKPPLVSEMIAPLNSGMMSPPERGLVGNDRCCLV